MEFNDVIASRKNKEGKKLKPQAELDMNDYLESPSKRDKKCLIRRKDLRLSVYHMFMTL
jgi:hypothetical protein